MTGAPRPEARRPRQSAVVLALLVLGAGAWGLSQAGTSLVVHQPVAAPQAILSLGSHEWERLPVAADIAAREPTARVLLTEPVRPTPANCSNCSNRVAWLGGLGVARDRVKVLNPRVTNTYEEALVARDFCTQQGITRLVVVTSPYHTRRALATFEAVFLGSGVRLGVEPALEHSPARPDSWWTRTQDRWYVPYEWTALAWYTVRHSINPFAGGRQEGAS